MRKCSVQTRLAISLIGLLLPQLASTASSEPVEITPMEASYTAQLEKGIPIDGSATASLSRRKNGWYYHFDVDSFIADIRESARFRWDGQQVLPDTYRYSLEGLMISNRYRSLSFNWAANRVKGHYEGTDVDYDLPPNALGPMTYQIQLRQDLKRGLTEMSYDVVSEKGLDQDRFAVLGEETLETRMGSLRAIKLEKVRAPEKKRETYLWFAPEWDYLLVRLVQIAKDGTRYEIRLENAKVNGRTVTALPKP